MAVECFDEVGEIEAVPAFLYFLFFPVFEIYTYTLMTNCVIYIVTESATTLRLTVTVVHCPQFNHTAS